jgi:hypothetical protein
VSVTTHHGDCLDVLRGMGEASIDAVVTDPPAGISMMGKSWDHDRGGRDAWVAWMSEVAAECLRVARPGAHALVWALPRTSHWTATAWENAGWEVRDRVAHLFGTGFPKSRNIGKDIDRAAGAEREIVGVRQAPGFARANVEQGAQGRSVYEFPEYGAPATDAAKQWQGWGTALKPAVEDWWLLRKPLACPTVAAQVLATGTGALNIDGCRVPTDESLNGGTYLGVKREADEQRCLEGGKLRNGIGEYQQPAGRWPANLCHDGSPEVLEAFAAFGERRTAGFFPALGLGEDELRFHYSAKASKADRAGSKHPTVKPVALMRWLCRLVTPPAGLVLDCFAGTGVTGEAALREGFSAVLIEREAEYVADIHARLARHRDEAPLLAGVAA